MTTVRAHWKLVLVAIVSLAAAAVILSLTALNSSESGASSAAASDAEQAMLEFSQCMRDNGVPSFPTSSRVTIRRSMVPIQHVRDRPASPASQAASLSMTSRSREDNARKEEA